MSISASAQTPLVASEYAPGLRRPCVGGHVLLIEDDRDLNEQLAELLTSAGYEVECCYDGERGLQRACSHQHHLVVLDVMLPKRDGFSVMSELRQCSQIPVIMLTARGAEEERIRGFSQGADDYQTKPFNTTEFLYRVEALLRRSTEVYRDTETNTVNEYLLGELLLNRTRGSVQVLGKTVEFTPVQFRLLWTLATHQGRVLSKAFLYQTVLSKTYGPHDRSLDMHLSRVRRKLSQAGWQGERLQTVHGKGYCLN